MSSLGPYGSWHFGVSEYQAGLGIGVYRMRVGGIAVRYFPETGDPNINPQILQSFL